MTGMLTSTRLWISLIKCIPEGLNCVVCSLSLEIHDFSIVCNNVLLYKYDISWVLFGNNAKRGPQNQPQSI